MKSWTIVAVLAAVVGLLLVGGVVLTQNEDQGSKRGRKARAEKRVDGQGKKAGKARGNRQGKGARKRKGGARKEGKGGERAQRGKGGERAQRRGGKKGAQQKRRGGKNARKGKKGGRANAQHTQKERLNQKNNEKKRKLGLTKKNPSKPLISEPEVPVKMRTDKADKPTVVMAVLDSARADHLSMCGYTRPTSPFLKTLATKRGVSFSCAARITGGWTLPNHATMFTGQPSTVHGADTLFKGSDLSVRPLGTGGKTLAEQLKLQGYQTVFLSANPMLSAQSGLTRGFDVVVTAERFGVLEGKTFVSKLRTLLDIHVDPDKPMFLFLNLTEARLPRTKIPAGLGWVDPSRAKETHVQRPSTLSHRYVKGDINDVELSELRNDYTNIYDYSLSRADETLSQSVDLLNAREWTSPAGTAGNFRMVITSSNGEFLAEHGFVGPGGGLYEGNSRVPLVFVPGDPSNVVTLHEPISTLNVYHLARDGALPATKVPVLATSRPHVRMSSIFDGTVAHYRTTSAAFWKGTEKWMWSNNTFQRFDLKSDPKEASPKVEPERKAPKPLRDMIAKLAVKPLAQNSPGEQVLMQRLIDLGYVVSTDASP